MFKLSGMSQITNRDSDQKVTDIHISILLVWKLKSTDIMYSIKPYLYIWNKSFGTHLSAIPNCSVILFSFFFSGGGWGEGELFYSEYEE